MSFWGPQNNLTRWPLRSLPATSPSPVGYGAKLRASAAPRLRWSRWNQNRRGLGGYEAPRGLAFWVVWVARWRVCFSSVGPSWVGLVSHLGREWWVVEFFSGWLRTKASVWTTAYGGIVRQNTWLARCQTLFARLDLAHRSAFCTAFGWITPNTDCITWIIEFIGNLPDQVWFIKPEEWFDRVQSLVILV